MRAQRARRSRFDSLAEEPEDDSNGYDDYAPSEESEDERPAARRSDTTAAKSSASSSSSSGTKTEDSDRETPQKPSAQDRDDEFQVQDNNDELCSACSSKKDSDKLLCCELCPRVYHLYCLKPPLKKVPDGDWYCSHCQKSLSLDNIEKFLAARTRAVDLEAEKAAEQAAEQQAAKQASAGTGKKRTGSDAGPLPSKKAKMASVQELHTASNAALTGSTSQSRSVSAGKSQSAGSTDKEGSLPQQAMHTAAMPDGKLDIERSDGLGPKATSNSVQDADSADRTVDGEDQHATVKGSAKALADSDATLQAAGMNTKKDAVKLTQVKEYFVKWKNKSYIHCSWVEHDDVVRVAKVSNGLNLRFKHYQRSVYGVPQVASSAKLEDQEAGELVNGIDPLWVLVERVIANQEKKGLGMHCLVKWKGLGYEDCTWEAAADLLPKFQAEIQRFKEQHPIANELAQRKRSHSQASTSQAGATRSAAGRKLGTRKFADSPSFLAGGGSLHPYQLEGLNWLYFAWEQSKHVILADEMGLGKTIQSIAFLAALREEEQVQKPHLVVVPLSTFPNWQREFALWAPQLNVVPFIGNQVARNVIKQHELYVDPSQHKAKAKTGSRNADLQARVKFHVLLTTYEMVGFEAGTLRSLEWETLLVDEGHRLKNQQSKLFQQLHNFKTRQRTLLTGTPLQNNLAELFMLLHFLDAGKFQSLEDFEANYSDFSHGEQIAKLHELLSPHLLRRLKKDVLKQLPPKKEQIVRVELSPLQKDWYRGILTKNFPNLTNGKQTGRLKSVMMELRKCCNHPFLIDEQPWPATRDPNQFLQELLQASGKLSLIDSMLRRMKPLGHRVLIYSQFTTLLNLLEEWLAARQWGFQRIDGSVGSAERQSRIDQFNTRPADNFVFLLSTKAGGLGINLASADTVVIYDSDWNPHNDLQAQARAHRLGQLKPVMIYRLVTRLTIEERMMQQAKKKLVLEHLVVHKMNTAADLKQDELDDILRYGAAELFADAAKAQQAAAADQDATADAAAGGKSASDKAEKLIRLSEREQAEGRTGGQAGRRIVYDDAAIERLLDRSDLANAEEDKADEKEDDFVKGFKVANFEIIESPDKGEKAGNEESAVEAPEAAEPQQPASVFWNELLQSGYQDLQQVQMQVLGKGKRERRQVNYDEKGDKGREDGSDYSALSEESGDDSDGKPALKKQKSDVVNMTEAQARSAQAVVQQRQGSLGAGKPLTTGAFSSLKVLGFTNAQRALFMKVLMQFGLGQQLAGGKFDWSHIQRHMATKWPGLTLEHTCRYAELVMLQLSEPANQLPFFADGILKKDILQNYELNKVLDRLGTLHLVRHTLLKQMTHPDNTFSLGPAYAATLRPFKYWQAEHDKRLLYGVLKHGWAQWQVILKDALLGIEPVLRKELFLPRRLSQQTLAVPASTAYPASGQATAAAADSKGLIGTSDRRQDAAGGASTAEQAAATGVKVEIAVTDSDTVQLQLSPTAAASAQLAAGLQSQQQQQQAPSLEGSNAAASEHTATQSPHSVPVKAAVKEEVIDLEASTSQAQSAAQSAQPDPKATNTAKGDSSAGVQQSLPLKQQQAQSAAAPPASAQANLASTHTAAKSEGTVSVSDAAPGTSAGIVNVSEPGTTAAGGPAGTAAPQGVFGCPKCRWSPKGCAVCRAKAQATSPAGAAARSPTAFHEAAERASVSKMTAWLMNRTSTLCHALKQSHQGGTPTPKPAPQQAKVTVTAASTKLVPSSSIPVVQTHQVKLSQATPTTIMKFPSVPAVTGGASAQWQQQQLSQLRQQQHALQQQQLAESQRQRQHMLLMQQQQRQHHTSLLQQQHQSAQLQQQQQRNASGQIVSSQALQQQQQRMRQQQQQQGLQQRQMEQQRQQQLQQQQQQLLQQQQQRQLNAQQQVQFALSRQGSGQQQGQQPRPAAVFASAAQHAQYQQQQQRMQPSSSGAYISHPLSQPDQAASPMLMTIQQPHLRITSLPGSPSLPASPSVSQQQAMRQYIQPQAQSQQGGQSGGQQIQAQSQAMLQSGQVQQHRQQGGQAGGQQDVSPLDPAFKLLSEYEKTRVLRDYLLKSKPNLQPIDLHKLFKQTGASPMLTKQALQDRLRLVDTYNQLCGKLLDVQVTLAQNRPHSMTDHDRNVAAVGFQLSMQGMQQSCAAMVQNLQSNYSSFCSPSPANLQPVLQGQGHHQGQHQAQQQQQQGQQQQGQHQGQQRHLLAAASRDSPRADSPARLGSREPSGHSDAAGRSGDLGEGSPRVGGQKGGGLASLITSRGIASPVTVHRLAAATVPASHDPANGGSAPKASAAQETTSALLQGGSVVQTDPVPADGSKLDGNHAVLSGNVAGAAKGAHLNSDADEQPKTAAAIDLTADSDEDVK